MADLKSAIVELTLPDVGVDPVPATMPTGGWSRMARALSEMAVHHVALGEHEPARRAVMDALLLLDSLDGVTAAEVSLMLGDALLALSEAHRARERFYAAVDHYDGQNDRARAARARVGLARAMWLLRDPAARAVLEDAGTLFEEIGDEAAVLAVDVELCAIEAELAEAPPSICPGVVPRIRL